MLTDPATFGRLILSFHKSYSVKGAKCRANHEFGKTPKNGTREHISELLTVKAYCEAIGVLDKWIFGWVGGRFWTDAARRVKTFCVRGGD